MAEFVQTMKDLRRMCKAYENNCDKCPLANYECCSTPKNRKYFTDEQIERIVMSWASEQPEPVYPAWRDWLRSQYPMMVPYTMTDILESPIPADIAQKLGIEPKVNV